MATATTTKLDLGTMWVASNGTYGSVKHLMADKYAAPIVATRSMAGVDMGNVAEYDAWYARARAAIVAGRTVCNQKQTRIHNMPVRRVSDGGLPAKLCAKCASHLG